ncbi:MAG: lipopolysaccharide biosynthesis protein [Pseudonocardiaceae bacterium]
MSDTAISGPGPCRGRDPDGATQTDTVDIVDIPAIPVDVVPGLDQPDVGRRPAGSPAGPPPAGWWGRLRSHLAEPFSRNAYALLLNTGLTGLLGIAFWLLAARYYADADVGRGSALISTMTLLSGVVAINLTGTLNRFIPQAGRWTRRLVLYSYGFSAVVVAVLAVGFVLTLGYWGASFELLRDPATALWFVAAVVAASIFTVQDGVLVGLRSAAWVPAENTLFGIAKIILLVLFAAVFPHNGVYLSWVIPMALLVLPINGLIFGRLIPRHVRATGETFLPPSPAGIGRFFAADYLGALFVFGAVYLVPVVVAASVQPVTFAYFYVAWMMGGILNLTAMNLAQSLTVEGAYQAHTLVRNCWAALRRAVGLLMVAAVVVALAAPYCLGLLGRGYLEAVPLLQILAFAALPRAVVEIWLGVLRAQNRPQEIARVQIASGALVIGSVLAWLQVVRLVPGLADLQITGVGLVVLASQTMVALVVLPGLWGFLTAAPSAGTAPVARSSFATRTRAQGAGGSAGRRVPAGWFSLAGVGVLTVAAALLYLVPLRGIDLDAMTGYGLISVLPAASLAGLALLTLAFMATLALRRAYRLMLGAQLTILVGCLHGVTALIEPLPRFAISWVHLGFVEYIGRTGTTAPALDGRFSWPGFFALVAFVTDSTRWQDLLPVLKLTPLLSNLLYLLAFALLLRNLRASWRATWFAAWLFCVLNWVGQDYFSPQGFGYGLYLIFIAILVTWFRPAEIRTTAGAPGPGRSGSFAWWRPAGGFSPGELPVRPAEHALRVTLLLLLLGVFVVASASHQLTPFLMVGACAGLVLARRCVVTGLPVLLIVILAGCIIYLSVG